MPQKDPTPNITSNANSGFYLSRKVVVFFGLVIVGLLLVSTVLAILYGKLRADKTQTVSATWDLPSTDWPPFSGRQGPWNNSRLPKTLIPRHYQLELWPRLLPGQQQLESFLGQVNLTVTCKEETEIILLHSQELNYSWVAISARRPGLRSSLTILDIWLEVQNQYLVIELNDTLVPGQDYTIQANYSGQLIDGKAGLCIHSYLEWGINKSVISSHFEATFARKVFPCFDEPALKATFDIRLVHRSQLLALSNMPAIDFSERLEEDGTWQVTTFDTTVKMSTYLLAFVISDYSNINTTYNDIEIRVWASKKHIMDGDADYALNITGPILSFFEEYFNISYPLLKLDLVGLSHFQDTAMENWGLVIFINSALLHHPKKDFYEDKLKTTLIIAHELAHQWLGNLATMKWWNDLWLKEGLSTYFEFIAASTVLPIDTDSIHLAPFVYLISCCQFDWFFHRLSEKEEDVSTADQVIDMFSTVSYVQGANVVHMISILMTSELLMEGLRSYIKTFSYSNAETDDLWNHLQMAVDNQDAIKLPASVKSIFDPWTKQSGFPLLTANTTSGIIKQEDYFTKRNGNGTSSSSWFVPIFWMKSGSMQPLIWLKGEYETFSEVKRTTDEEWILLNVNMSAFYRINYDDSNWHQLGQQLNNDPSVIPVVNRAQIISDAFEFAWRGFTDIENALGTTAYLAKEQEGLVWDLALDQLIQVGFIIITTSSYGLYKKYLSNRIAPFYYYQMNLINEDLNNIKNHEFFSNIFCSTMRTACLLGLKDCMDRTSKLLSQFMSDPTNITFPESLREAIFCGAIRAGTDKEWDFVFSMYQNQTLRSEDTDLISAMACSTEPWILNRYLHYTMDESIFTGSQVKRVLKSVASNPIGRFLVQKFIKENWQVLQNMFTEIYEWEFLSWILIDIVPDFEHPELQQFLENSEVLFVEITKKNFKWKKDNYSKIHNWLAKNTCNNVWGTNARSDHS
ncbi:aminopeptidase Q-like isoform X3 [Hypanus sabinus]|uniref:aminopeptidase Q-like isoform X3 n=1 Tax=Hypanus sabinus TaxID=79690 RepID=UPI0028C3D32E|nr:aminopeptidase Q-like isoform X3 [Hypanus sabinus]